MMASEKANPVHSKRHKNSATYALAVATETEGMKFLYEGSLHKALEKFDMASELYDKCENDYGFALCKDLYKFCKAVLMGNISGASAISKRLINKPVSGPIKDFLKIFAKTLASKITERQVDYGYAFESRVRELVSYFDDRVIKEAHRLGIYPPVEEIVLKKYDKVVISPKERTFKLESDEKSIINKSQIEIDILATRKECNRTYILIAECKLNDIVKAKDSDELLRKAKVIEKIFSKKLMNEDKPVVEEIWYITTGEFTENAKKLAEEEFVKGKNIRLIDKNALNNLFREFGLHTIK